MKSAIESFGANSTPKKAAGLVALAGISVVLSLALLARSAGAEINDALLRFGSGLRGLGEAKQLGEREVQVNGARFQLHSGSVAASFEEVLASHERACASELARPFHALGPVTDSVVSRSASVLGAIATSSVRNGDRGYVACLELDSSLDRRDLLERFVELSRTGSLDSLGGLRYTYVERDRSAGREQSFVLMVRARFESLIRGLLPPPDADAEGRDLVGVPRPEGSRRILSAWESDGPSGVFTYLTHAGSPSEIESFYRSTLSVDGWQLVEPRYGTAGRVGHTQMVTAQQGARWVSVLARPAHGGETIVTILASEAP